LPAEVAAALNAEYDTAFAGHPASGIDLSVTVERTRQLAAVRCHPSQAVPGSVLWRRLELLGDTEHARWLHDQTTNRSRRVPGQRQPLPPVPPGSRPARDLRLWAHHRRAADRARRRTPAVGDDDHDVRERVRLGLDDADAAAVDRPDRVIVWAAVMVARRPADRPAEQPRRETPQEILDRRFASGEIDADAFTQARPRLAGREVASP
jgi:hypothetical protein